MDYDAGLPPQETHLRCRGVGGGLFSQQWDGYGFLRTMHRTPSKVRAVSLCVALLAAALIWVDTARAQSSSYTFRGSGFGHGLGMSQYGARGAADGGMSYDQILRHFYQGTSVESRSLPSGISVGLAQGQSAIQLSGNGRFDFVMSGHHIASGGPNQTWTVRPAAGGAYRIEGPGGAWTVGDPTQWLEVHYEAYGTLLSSGGHQYKYGWFEVNTHVVGSSWTVRSIINTVMFHQAYHAGQTAVLRRIAGKEGAIR